MESLRKNKKGSIQYIALGIVILVISALAVPIIFSVLASTTGSSYDTLIANNFDKTGHAMRLGNTTYVFKNATTTTISTSGTVLGLNPLAALVAVAAGMISLLISAIYIGRPGGGI